MKNRKVLVIGNNPPQTYTNALKAANVEYGFELHTENYRRYSGLLLVGGSDVTPSLYGRNVFARNVNVVRDKAEYDALEYFVSHELPVMGVCRGAQIINVFFGGTLENCRGHISDDGNDVEHKVFAVTNKKPFNTLEKVNSCHRQRVKKLSSAATPDLYAEDGTIESFTLTDLILATQFHPERMDERISAEFYGRFAAAVRNGRFIF